jgi:DNA ligase-1
MKFLEISLLRDRVSKIKSLNKKVELLSQFFKRLSEDEIEIATRFLIGRIFSPKSHLVLDMSWKTIREVKAFIKERKSGSLSINDVYLALCEIANVKGKGSKDKKRKILKTLMEKMDEKEESFLINCIFSELRQGVKEGVMRKAISSFLRISPSLIQRAEMFLSDLGEVAKIGAIKGKEGLEKIGINLFIPVEPMLAEVSKDIRKVLKYHKGKTAIEYKLMVKGTNSQKRRGYKDILKKTKRDNQIPS